MSGILLINFKPIWLDVRIKGLYCQLNGISLSGGKYFEKTIPSSQLINLIVYLIIGLVIFRSFAVSLLKY